MYLPYYELIQYLLYISIYYRERRRKLYIRVKKSKSIIEKLYLKFEIAKCNILIGSEYHIKARNISAECFQYAHEINSHTWIINILIISGIIEYRLDNTSKCCKMINKAIEISHKLKVPGVIMFLQKVSYR